MEMPIEHTWTGEALLGLFEDQPPEDLVVFFRRRREKLATPRNSDEFKDQCRERPARDVITEMLWAKHVQHWHPQLCSQDHQYRNLVRMYGWLEIKTHISENLVFVGNVEEVRNRKDKGFDKEKDFKKVPQEFLCFYYKKEKFYSERSKPKE